LVGTKIKRFDSTHTKRRRKE